MALSVTRAKHSMKESMLHVDKNATPDFNECSIQVHHCAKMWILRNSILVAPCWHNSIQMHGWHDENSNLSNSIYGRIMLDLQFSFFPVRTCIYWQISLGELCISIGIGYLFTKRDVCVLSYEKKPTLNFSHSFYLVKVIILWRCKTLKSQFQMEWALLNILTN